VLILEARERNRAEDVLFDDQMEDKARVRAYEEWEVVSRGFQLCLPSISSYQSLAAHMLTHGTTRIKRLFPKLVTGLALCLSPQMQLVPK
jgi:hypothetical protein